MSAPEPTITGDLERTPFLHVMLSLHSRAATGTLAVWPPDADTRGQDRIHYRAGVPEAARFVSTNTPFLDKALLTLFPRERGLFAFYADVDLVGEDPMRGRIDPFALAAASLRGPSRLDAVATVLEQHEGTLRLVPGIDFKKFNLLAKEERLLEVVRAGPCTASELADACELGPEYGRRLTYLLLVTRALIPYASTPSGAPRQSIPATRTPVPAPQAAGSPPSGGSQPRPVRTTPVPVTGSRPRSSTSTSGTVRAVSASISGMPAARNSVPPPASPDAPPPGLSPESLHFFLEIKQRSKLIESQNYFDMLGVPKDANGDLIRKTFLQLAKKWHPDRLPPELGQLRPEAEQIFHHLTTAHDTLVDDQKRAAHLKNVQDGGGTPEADRKLAAIMTAAMEQQKAEVLMKRRDFAGARALLEHAITLSPDDADLNASYAWALLQGDGSTAVLPDVLRLLDRAISLSPTHDRAHFSRGVVLRRMDREAEAIAAFRRAAEANPRNLDAEREVRLARMRGQLDRKSDQAPKKDEGILSKLFGSSGNKKK